MASFTEWEKKQDKIILSKNMFNGAIKFKFEYEHKQYTYCMI